jgi:polysaccharide biosynthesis transport protein
MRGGRTRLPVLAEITGPAAGGSRVWSLRREDHRGLAAVRERLQERRAVLVTGTEEATAALAVALAGASCAAGRRTVLVECDLARPQLAAELGLAQLPGLHEYLRWEVTAREVLRSLALGGAAAATATGPLVCVPAGRQAANARVLLGLQSFRHMAAKLRNAYDLVVLAGPPLGSDEEAVGVVAAEADAVLAALAPAQASRRGRRAVRAAVGRLPASALGAVIVGEP